MIYLNLKLLCYCNFKQKNEKKLVPLKKTLLWVLLVQILKARFLQPFPKKSFSSVLSPYAAVISCKISENFQTLFSHET